MGRHGSGRRGPSGASDSPSKPVGGAVVLRVDRLLALDILIGVAVGGELGALPAFRVVVLGVGGRLRLALLALLALIALLVELVGEVECGEKVTAKAAERILIEQTCRSCGQAPSGRGLRSKVATD